MVCSDLLVSAMQGDDWAQDWLGRTAVEAGWPVVNPADGQLLVEVTPQSVADLPAVVDSAVAAQYVWAGLTAPERSEILRRWQNLVGEHAEVLARLVTLEQGKVFAEAQAEVRSALRYIEWFCEEARRAYGRTIPAPRVHQQMMTLQQPVGVVAAMIPWNFPAQLIARKCAPALAAGCAVIAKPSPQTPLSALALADLAYRAGVPPATFPVVVGDAVALGTALCDHAAIRMVSFTGSTTVGQAVLARCAHTTKKTVMELGGNAPFVVFADADLDHAVGQLIASRFRNAGQTCVSANRIFVQRPVYDDFQQRLRGALADLRPGAGFDERADIGPLIDQRAFDRVAGLVQRAVRQGAELIVGGRGDPSIPLCYLPTLLGGLRPDMEIFATEIFGPVVAMMAFDREQEALTLSNDTPYGLAAYVFTRDLARAWRMVSGLDCGLVGVNNGVLSSAAAPFGGVKDSGLGREGGVEGLAAFLETRYVNFDYRS